ncbi:MAG: ligase-associated DNA damage response endonuclease PdeM [Planctomycetota bacterium]
MSDSVVELDWGGHAWQLRPDRTVYWQHTRTLILADPHFGKAQFFRGAGIPVPAGTTRSNLDRLSLALDATHAKRLVVLGDFFHSHRGVTPDLLEQLRGWRDRWPDLEIINLRGNHDRQAGDPPADLEIRCFAGSHQDTSDPSVAFAHEPVSVPDAVTMCGHLHPAVRLQGPAKSRLRTACFHFMETTAVLPAFGAFTGMKAIRPSRSDRVFAVGPDTVVEVSTQTAVSTNRAVRR